MIDLLEFYNIAHSSSHNGDIHFSREYVKHFMKYIPAKKYIYIHDQSPRCLVDIPDLEYSNIKNKYDCSKKIEYKSKHLLINMWPYYNIDKKLFDEYEDFLFYSYDFFKKTIAELNKIGIYVPPPASPINYTPKINYKLCDCAKIDNFININNNKIKILICNGDCRSNQIENFNFDNLIKSIENKYGINIVIITTKKTDIDNVYYTGDIIKTPNGDLNEISYLSRFCDIIIGRGSGPFCFCEVEENVNDSKKRFIGITKNIESAFWRYYPKIMRWTPNYQTDHLLNIFNKCLCEIKIKVL